MGAAVVTVVLAAGQVARAQGVFNLVGIMAQNWGVWVEPGLAVEDWIDEARAYCADDDICDVRIFEGPELATHEVPVPEENRAGLRWIFRYRAGETPPIVVEEAHGQGGAEPRTWTFDQ
tara:strand:+ start:151 stop:507 length:357 start_codon:yes stop_codon:yes gene_type:complete